MLSFLAETCTAALLEHHKISEDLKAVYNYGFQLFWSTVLCIMSILGLSVFGGYWASAITFLIYFMPIRGTAGGYHAKSYGHCFLLTNSIAVLCVMVSKCLACFVEAKTIAWAVLIVLTGYIWVKAPVVSKKYILSQERLKRNRKYAHGILIMEAVMLLFIEAFSDSSIFYTAVITTCAVTIMFIIEKRKEE